MQIRDDADYYDYQAAERQYPSEHRTPVEKQQTDAEQQRYQRHAEGVVTPQRPIPAHHRHAAQKQVASGDHHSEAENELADTARRAARPTNFIFLFHLLLSLSLGRILLRAERPSQERIVSRNERRATPRPTLRPIGG